MLYKINDRGEFLPFYGWTAIMEIENSVSFIEKFIESNSVLKKYFSPLPAKSYHMTLYNIWCNGRELLPYQKWYINEKFPKNIEEYINKSKNYGLFNPNNCMEALLQHLQCLLDEEWEKTVFKCCNISHQGSTLTIFVEGNEDRLQHINKLRQNFISSTGIDDNMSYYHITLAYQYKDIPVEDKNKVLYEIKNLSNLMNNYEFNLTKPFVASFNDMTKFTPCFDNSQKCLGFLVPDFYTQKELTKFGIDITAPMSSFKVNPLPFEYSTTFGGIHISMFRRKKYTKECLTQLKTIGNEFKNSLKKPWSLPENSKIVSSEFQSNIIFEAPELKNICEFAKLQGWSNVVNSNFHIGLYSSSLTTKPTHQQETEILRCLKSAKWGFILSIDNGDKRFHFDWNTFIPV